MDINAHLKVEMVLNGDEEDEEEKRFNEIICYDSGGDSCEESNENEQSDTTQRPTGLISLLQNSLQNQNNEIEAEKSERKSNAAQMRKYRAKQRSDPIKYQRYLERERTRNYKRKYEKAIQEAQEEAQALGIPYIVFDPPYPKRGRKRIFGPMSLVLPAKFNDNIDNESNSFDSDDIPMVPVKIEMHESVERKPQISVVNINKLIHQPRSALQTLLPEDVNDRVSNLIRSEHGYVKQEQLAMFDGQYRKRPGKNKRKTNKNDLLQLQEQCRNFILDRAASSVLPKRNRRRRRRELSPEQSTPQFTNRNCVEHEDLDDLFRELEEVAYKEPSKKKHSSSHHKIPSAKRSPRKQSSLKGVRGQDDGKFSLTVSMPVKPMVASMKEYANIKEEPQSPTDPCIGNDDRFLTSLPNYNLDVCNGNSIEIKQEPVYPENDIF